MVNSSSNATVSSSKQGMCVFGRGQVVVFSVIDLVTLLVGQPVITKLLWIAFTSKKTTEILNSNLAVFHNLHYLISISHLIALLWLPARHHKILMFLLVYVQTGGPMSLCFISLERYVAVIHPTSYPLLKTYRCREVCAAMVWLISVPSALASVLVPEAFICSEGIMENIPFGVMVTMAVMMVGCSYSVARALNKSGPGRDELHPAKKRALKTVCTTSALVLFCYIPVTTLQKFKYLDVVTFECLITPVCIFLLSVAGIVHPLFYLSTRGKLFTCSK